MARDFHENVVGAPAAVDNKFVVLGNVEVWVYPKGAATLANFRALPAGSLASIFQRDTGVAAGPSPEAGATSGTNPFITGLSGSIQFWAERGDYEIFLHDLTVPARIGDRMIPWNSTRHTDIPGTDIRDRTIAAVKIVANSLTANELAPDSVGSSELANDAVDNAAMASNAVGNAEMMDDAIGIAEVIDGVQYSQDLTARAINGNPAVVGTDVTVTVVVGDSGMCAVMFTWEILNTDVNSNGWVQVTRDGTAMSDAMTGSGLWSVGGFAQWLGGGSTVGAGVFNKGGCWVRLAEGSSPTQFGLIRIPMIDEPGAGSHTYKILAGGTGNGGQIRNRRLWAWPIQGI